MKGGMFRIEGLDDNNVGARFFAANSTWKILTNSSISCITFKLRLNHGVVSPFRHVRPHLHNREVRTLLLKLFPMTERLNDEGRDRHVPGMDRGLPIEIATFDEVLSEFDIQRHVYSSTFVSGASLLDPICPYPISIIEWRDMNELDQVLNNRLIPRQGVNRNFENELDEIRRTLALEDYRDPNVEYICGVAMEFMDDFDVYHSVIQRVPIEQRDWLHNLRKYEYDRLHTTGIIHNDFHEANAMVSLDYPYMVGADNHANDPFRGRVLIIDFGRATRMTHDQRQLPFDRIDRELEHRALVGPYRRYRGRDIDYGILRGQRVRFSRFLRQHIVNTWGTELTQFHALIDHLRTLTELGHYYEDYYEGGGSKSKNELDVKSIEFEDEFEDKPLLKDIKKAEQIFGKIEATLPVLNKKMLIGHLQDLNDNYGKPVKVMNVDKMTEKFIMKAKDKRSKSKSKSRSKSRIKSKTRSTIFTRSKTGRRPTSRYTVGRRTSRIM